MKSLKQLFLITAMSLVSTTAQAFTVTIEDPEIQAKPSGDELFTVDFNDLAVDTTNSFTMESSDGINAYTYSGDLLIRQTNIHGGADNSYYIEPRTLEPSSFNIVTDKNQKYFGFWWSAGDASNIITFFNNDEIVATFHTQDVIATLAELPNKQNYYCNPTPMFAEEVCHEPYAFVNFFFEGEEAYNRVTISSTASGSNFESDNHTFSTKPQEITGCIIADGYICEFIETKLYAD